MELPLICCSVLVALLDLLIGIALLIVSIVARATEACVIHEMIFDFRVRNSRKIHSHFCCYYYYVWSKYCLKQNEKFNFI